MFCQEFSTYLKLDKLFKVPRMKTVPLIEINEFIENIVESYETRLQNMEVIFTTSEAVTESSNTLLQDFHYSLTDLRKDRDNLNTQLRETLAKNGSLRRKDYDNMMKYIFEVLEKKEKEAEMYFCQYIEDQKSMARSIKKGLLSLKDTKSQNSTDKIKVFKLELDHVTREQEVRKEFVIKQFQEYQDMQNDITAKFNRLLNSKKEPLTKDIKNIIRDFIRKQNIQKAVRSTGLIENMSNVQPAPI